MLLFPLAILTGIVVGVTSLPANAAPLIKHAGKVKTGSYIIKLKDGALGSGRLVQLLKGSEILYTFDEAFHGYAARLNTKSLESLQLSSDVESIYEDGIVDIDTTTSGALSIIQKSSPVSTVSSGLNERAGGSGVDVYDIGTGILTSHSAFGGRARWGATFGGYTNTDGNGISTCHAGIAVGNPYGIAQQANAIAVKAISDSGSATVSDLIAAINWVVSAVAASGRPSIAMMGVGGAASSALDSAVNNAILKGIHFVVPAGSSGIDAGNTSPARVAAAVTVGAVDAAGRRASFSNYGAAVDIYALGVNVLCPWIGGNTATRTISGTTLAMANVTGVLAVAIDNHGNKLPAALQADLKSNARVVNGILIAQVW